jgi:large subunit ribosomal protein L7/L12
MNLDLEGKIAAVEKRLSLLRQQRRRKEAAERAAASKKDRADDTRRKILAGAIALSDPGLNRLVMDALAKRLARPDDRALFGFVDSVDSEQPGDGDDTAGGNSGRQAEQEPTQPTGGGNLGDK